MKTALYVDNFYHTLGPDFSTQMAESRRQLDLRIRAIISCLEKLHDTEILVVWTDQYLVNYWQDVPEKVTLIVQPEVSFSIFSGGRNMWKGYLGNKVFSEIYSYVTNPPLQGALGEVIPMISHPEVA